ncbi:MAG: hypothetical protein M1825_000788 [Sarcosagium campestre]|nr:MAG: hypothetical protein M1825_000788 [Sarcosagium campestre]
MVSKDTPTVSFNDVVQAGREKKKNELLAEKIFGKGRRASAPGPGIAGRKAPPTGPSLASRMGVTKRSVSAAPKPGAQINGRWNHDLHRLNNPQASRVSRLPTRGASARISRDNKLFAALQSDAVMTDSGGDINILGASNGLSIRGSAGPYTVTASNFAPGTTATDIHATMEPIGGEIVSCRLTTADPTVIAEIVFAERQGAERVIATFNNQRADGRLLHVYLSPTRRGLKLAPRGPSSSSGGGGNSSSVNAALQKNRAERERLQADIQFQDGSYGFANGNNYNQGDSGLYSDRMMARRRPHPR